MILVKPYLGCIFRCAYCYQGVLRENKNPYTERNYDIDAITSAMERLYKEEPHHICLHGGEPLALPIEDIEAILKKSYELEGKSAIQTNGYMINDENINLFKKYKTSVGISIDGFYPENRLRGFPDNKKKCKESTEKVLKNIETLCAENIVPGMIVVLHKANAIGKHLDHLKDFIVWLSKLGVRGGKLNPCSVDDPRKVGEIELSVNELKKVWLDLADFIFKQGLEWDPMHSMARNLRGGYLGDCIFSKCDFWSTRSAQVVLGDGSISCCGHTCGVLGSTFIRSGQPTSERYEILEKIDCKGCRYYPICNGGCPSRGVNGDWRNKDKYCEAIYALYNQIENYIRAINPGITLVIDQRNKPQSSSSSRREDSQYKDWSNHGDSTKGCDPSWQHRDEPHVDSEHADSHGDWNRHGDWSDYAHQDA